MELTPEQHKIINSAGNIKINAVAGSGKTTTIIEYARARPASSRILYLAFNKTVKLEAQKKFTEKGITNVKVETAHSLAYKHIVFQNNYKIKKQDFKSYEIAEILGITGSGEKHAEYIIANHINKFISFFCNSDKPRVQDLNYLDVVTDVKAKTFVKNYYPYIENLSRIFLSKMDKGEIEVIHDFYLKKFQLLNPQLHYDYILFDEGQDASAAMLDIFIKQQATKVIVGDTHQQIYGWRYAVNSLEKIDFPTYHLSSSFRFGQPIANLAREVLQLKTHLGDHKEVQITGLGKGTGQVSKAVIGRTNLGLLLKAIAYVTEKKNLQHIYFEGNIHSYTYADEGASLYDVLNLYNRKPDMIRDKLVKAMSSMTELKDYIDKTEDVQLGMMVEIVEQYGNEIPGIIKSIKDRHVGDGERDKAEIIFSTVHRCKGMEYDVVQVVNDFITEEKLEKLNKEEIAKHKLNEEINLLYVAVTRTKNSLYIPESLMPKNFAASPEIHVIKTEPKEEDEKQDVPDYQQPHRGGKVIKGDFKKKYNTVATIGKKHKEPYKPWLPEDDTELTSMYQLETDVYELAKHFERSSGAIMARLKKLNLLPAKPFNKW